jgi:hypothetical protein
MLRSTLGLLSLAVGLIGLLVPLLPGIPFLVLAWLLLRRGDRHWRRHPLYRRPYDMDRRYHPRDDGYRDDLSPGERLRLRALQGTSGVLRQLDRVERSLRGDSRPRLSGPR